MREYIVYVVLSALCGYACRSAINYRAAQSPIADTDWKDKCKCSASCRDIESVWTCVGYTGQPNNESSNVQTLSPVKMKKILSIGLNVSIAVLIMICLLVNITKRIKRRRILASEDDNGHGCIDRPANPSIGTSIKDVKESTCDVHVREGQFSESAGNIKDSREDNGKGNRVLQSSQGNLKELDDVEERIMCKICLSRKISVVFRPCNHMVACSSCSDFLDRCAVCRTVIKGTFIAYTPF